MENSTSIQELQESEEKEKSNKNELSNKGKNIETINQKDDYNSIIIKPPPKRDIFKNKIKNLLIDSRDRNYDKYPETSKFEIELKEEYKYVKSINLVMAQIPSSQYLINISNNVLEYFIGNIETKELKKITIQKGNYPDPNPINNYLPNILPTLELLNSIIYSDTQLYRDLLSKEIQQKFKIYKMKNML